jgi:pimeloyl-ACP methyl ester carboxylesterase
MDFSERVPQGMANWLVLTHAVGREMKDLPALKRPDTPGEPGVSTSGGASNQGQLTYEGPAANFIGISMGAILGGTLAALDPDLTRVALNVGGAGFTHLMMRARPFEGFLSLLELSIKDPLTQQAYLATLQRHFDRFDPATWAVHVLADPLPGSPDDRRVVLQVGLGDSAVPNLGSNLRGFWV